MFNDQGRNCELGRLFWYFDFKIWRVLEVKKRAPGRNQGPDLSVFVWENLLVSWFLSEPG